MVITVTGETDAAALGYTLPHEHILCDLRPLVGKPAGGSADIFYQKVTLQNHGLLLRNPYAVLDNAVLDEEDIQIAEITEWKNAGGGTIVDVTTSEIGRNPVFLRKASETAGIRIVASSGNYIDAMHTAEFRQSSVSSIAERIIREITIGIGGTGIRAGVIGEIGTSDEITDSEYKSLEAASIAQRETNAGMHIHASLWNRSGLAALEFAVKKGANPQKICINHVDVKLDMEYITSILELGAMVEFDNFGKEFYVDKPYRSLLKGSFATDRERVAALKHLVDRGFLTRILVSNDICLKTLTHYYGGWGYDHILTNIYPMMLDYGITEEQADTILKDNPARFLDI